MGKKRKHTTTKNTAPKPPVTNLLVIGVECNGSSILVTDFKTEEEFRKVFEEWFNSPDTYRWCSEALIAYINKKYPQRICMLEEDYKKMVKVNAVIEATREEWESENN